MQTANPELLKSALAQHEIARAPAGSSVAIAREMMLLPLSAIEEPDLYRVCVTEGARILNQVRPPNEAEKAEKERSIFKAAARIDEMLPRRIWVEGDGEVYRDGPGNAQRVRMNKLELIQMIHTAKIETERIISAA